MKNLAQGAYTAAQVEAALRGGRTLDFRYERYDKFNNLLGEFPLVISGSVSHSALSDIKRTGKVEVSMDSDVDYLNDRIMPYVRLKMGEHTETQMVPGPKPSVVNLLPKASASFEDGTVGGWSGIGSLPPALSVNTLFSVDGTHIMVAAFPIGANSGNSAAMVGNLPVEAGKTYTISASVYSPGPNGFGFSAYGGVGVTGYNRVVQSTSGVLVRVYSTFTALGTGVVTVQLDNATTMTAVTNVWIDAVQLEEGVTSPGPYVTPDQTPWLIPMDVPVEDWVEWPLGLFLLSTPTRTSDSSADQHRSIDLYDQTQILLDDKLTDRLTISAGTTVTTAVTGQLTAAGITRQNVSTSAATLPADRDWDPGTPRLQVINDLLEAINYGGVWFDSLGYAVCVPYVSPDLVTPGWNYYDDAGSVSFAEAEATLDLFGVPNKWVLVVSEPDQTTITSTYTNSNPTSPTSTVNRGRTIVDYRTDSQAVDQVTLDAQAARAAYEASQVYEQFSLNTGIIPIHEHLDIVNLRFNGLDASGKYQETDWEFDLSVGSVMKHTLRKLVSV